MKEKYRDAESLTLTIPRNMKVKLHKLAAAEALKPSQWVARQIAVHPLPCDKCGTVHVGN